MTARPVESHSVVGLSGEGYESYKVGPTCAVPGCTHYADHAHHLFSRGLMGGAFPYVRLPDGTEVGNLSPLCFRHHEQVTNNEINILWEDDCFLWEGEPLTSQPPIITRVNDHVEHVHSNHGNEVNKFGREICRGCGRPIPRPPVTNDKDEEKKIRKTWSVAVPYTEDENGADTIDALLEAARDEMDRAGLNWGDGHKVKFYVLTTALALFVEHSDKILSDG